MRQIWRLATFALGAALYLTNSPPQDLYLAENETAVVAISDFFIGNLLDFELKSASEYAILQSNAQVRELASMQTAGYSVGPAFQQGSKECFVRYNSSASVVYALL